MKNKIQACSPFKLKYFRSHLVAFSSGVRNLTSFHLVKIWQLNTYHLPLLPWQPEPDPIWPFSGCTFLCRQRIHEPRWNAAWHLCFSSLHPPCTPMNGWLQVYSGLNGPFHDSILLKTSVYRLALKHRNRPQRNSSIAHFLSILVLNSLTELIAATFIFMFSKLQRQITEQKAFGISMDLNPGSATYWLCDFK